MFLNANAEQRSMRVVLVIVAGLCGGCSRSETSPAKTAVATTRPAEPPQVAAAGPFEVVEGTAFTHHPQVTNAARFPGGMQFEAVDRLPDGCTLDAETGEIAWTPGETQGPGKYAVEIACACRADPQRRATFRYEWQVRERNAAPQLRLPVAVMAEAGQTLDLPLGVSDEDFPSNAVAVRLAPGGPRGMTLDGVQNRLAWEIPRNATGGPRAVEILASDDGTPARTTARRLVIHIVPPLTAAPPPSAQPAVVDEAPPLRTPDLYVDLPALPRPGEQIVRTALPLPTPEGEAPAAAPKAARLSLLVPDELKRRLSIEYPGKAFDRIAIKLTEPFEAETQEHSPPDGAVAECAFDGKQLWWTWALTSDLRIRSYQNTVRQCVVALESGGDAAARLIALQTPYDVTQTVSIGSVLARDDARLTLTRHERMASQTSLAGHNFRIDHGSSPLPVASRTDGNRLLLACDALRGRTGFAELAFVVTTSMSEIAITFDSRPSVIAARDNAVAARKKRVGLQTMLIQGQRNLAAGQAEMNFANRMPEKTAGERVQKATKRAFAQRKIATGQAAVARAAAEIPIAEGMIAKTQNDFQAMVNRLKPIADYRLTGDVYRLIGDVQVLVLKVRPAPPPEPMEEE